MLNYVQARQLSSIIDAVIKKMSADPEELMELLTVCTKNGSSFSTKPITDLVKAAEAVQLMTARALGDNGGQQETDKVSGGSIGLSVARALNEVALGTGLDPLAVVKKSLENKANDDSSGHSRATPPASS